MKKLILSSLGFVVIYNLLFFEIDFGVGIGLFFFFLNLFYFFTKDKSTQLKKAFTFSVISTVFGLLIGFRSNEILKVLNFILASFFSFIALHFYKAEGIFPYEIAKFLLIPLNLTISSLRALRETFSVTNYSQDKHDNKLMSAFLRGVIIVLPIFALLVILLTHADPIFNKLIGNFFENIWQRILVSTFIFIGLINIGFLRIKEFTHSKEVSLDQASHKTYELIIIIGSIAFLFAIFIAIQFRYFFSNIGERELHKLGIFSLTYSEYVRKGFFELVAASTIAILVMFYALRFLHKLKGRHKLLIQILSSVFIIEIGLILISAFQRINLYALTHGLTRARVFGVIFLIWLAITLIILLIQIIKQIKKEWIFKLSLAPAVVIFLVSNIINIDGLIATKFRPSVNGEIDYYYLSDLSFDAADTWKDAVIDSKKVVDQLEAFRNFSSEDYRKFYWAKNTLERLDSKIDYLKLKYGHYQNLTNNNSISNIDFKTTEKKINKLRKWQSYNLGEFKAYTIVLQNKDIFDQLTSLLEKANNYDATRVSESIRNTAPLDRSTQPPLL